MSERKQDPLDAALAALPREVEPARDLWREIRTEIDAVPVVRSRHARRSVETATWYRLAAAVLLVVATALVTYAITRQSVEATAPLIATDFKPAPTLTAMPASFGGQAVLGPDYLRARAALDAQFAERLATLPPVERAKVERNLADLRRAAHEISATLAQHPSDPLLHELLLSTYQTELKLLADVNELTAPAVTRTDL